jgi:4-hydroxy-tetrahydrodipicolinate synthase
VTSRFGASAALTTPFAESGAIDLGLLASHARQCIERGCRSVTLFGTTGEGASVANDEQDQAFGALLAAGLTPQQLVAGVLVNAAGDAAGQARHALDLGARNVLLAPPSYFKGVSDDGLYHWFAEVFSRLGTAARDVLVYNIPSVTQVKISHALIARLRQSFSQVIAGVKDSGGDWSYSEQLLKDHGDLVILIGDERHLAQSVRLGGQGAISGMANFETEAIVSMAENGTDDPRVVGFVDVLLQHQVTPAVKTIVAERTGNASWLRVRPPLDPIGPDARQKLASRYRQAFAGA